MTNNLALIPRRRWGWLVVAVVYTGLFIALTLTLRQVDVATMTLNTWWQNVVGVNTGWHVISNVVAVMTIAAVGVLLVSQVVAFYRTRSLRRLARDWWVLDVVLIALFGFYLFFQIVVINYRPITPHGNWEAAYPSSHVLLFATVWPLVSLTAARTMPQPWRRVVIVLSSVLLLLGIVARLLSGYHWLTDGLGGVVLGWTLVCWYQTLVGNMTCHPRQSRLN